MVSWIGTLAYRGSGGSGSGLFCLENGTHNASEEIRQWKQLALSTTREINAYRFSLETAVD